MTHNDWPLIALLAWAIIVIPCWLSSGKDPGAMGGLVQLFVAVSWTLFVILATCLYLMIGNLLT